MKVTFTNVVLFFLFFGIQANAQIVITEINYNHPLFDDNEFVELYNNSLEDIKMEGYYFGDGVIFTFPEFSFPSGTYLVVAIDAPTFMEEYGLEVFEFESGTLSNSGEDISIYTSDSILVDYVDYEDNTDGWSSLADGRGHSLSLCDINSDNEDPNNWEITVVDNPVTKGRTAVHASPGAPANCSIGPIVSPTFQSDLIEGVNMDGSVDTAYIRYSMTNGNGQLSLINVSIDPSSTASPDDYTIVDQDVLLIGTEDVNFFARIVGNDDDVAEGVETLVLNLEIGTNVQTLVQDQVTILIYDDDHAPTDPALVIAGVFSADVQRGPEGTVGVNGEFGVELYALQDIPDLSIYGLGSANNGGGTDGIEIPFPAVSLNAGDNFFLAESEARFNNFFGFAPDFTHPSIFVTGNDAIELFEHGRVIDTYAPIDIDPAGSIWDYEDGWAVRKPNTGPDGTVPDSLNWIFSGTGVLIAETNDTAESPYPFNSYFNTVSVNEVAAAIDLQIFPNPVRDRLYLEFDQEGTNEIEALLIYNSFGSLVLQTPLERRQDQLSVDVAHFSPGIYFVTLKTSQGLATAKFVK